MSLVDWNQSSRGWNDEDGGMASGRSSGFEVLLVLSWPVFSLVEPRRQLMHYGDRDVNNRDHKYKDTLWIQDRNPTTINRTQKETLKYLL